MLTGAGDDLPPSSTGTAAPKVELLVPNQLYIFHEQSFSEVV
jgi:hypothetical protein